MTDGELKHHTDVSVDSMAKFGMAWHDIAELIQ